MPTFALLTFAIVAIVISIFSQSPQASAIPVSLQTVFRHTIPARQQIVQPKIQARSAVVLDEQSGYRLLDISADREQPIASLTKLMTALVFLDHNPGWDKSITITKEDLRGGAKANIFPGDQIKIQDLFNAALVASDNSGISALVRSTGLNEKDFVTAMNNKANELHVRGIHFADPTGLDTNNQGSALAVAKLAQVAFNKKEIVEALGHSSYGFSVSNNVNREVKSTNELLGKNLPKGSILVGGKTGHLNEAGFCFAGVFKYNGHTLATAVLGAPIDEERFSETIKILDWTMRAYVWEN